MQTLQQKREDLRAHFGAFQAPELRLRALLEAARLHPRLTGEERTGEHQVPGCLSSLWIICEEQDGRCIFRCESEARIVQAVAGLLCDFYSHATPAEILATPPDFLRELGVTAHLTANRRNALSRIWETIRSFAATRPPPTAPSPTCGCASP